MTLFLISFATFIFYVSVTSILVIFLGVAIAATLFAGKAIYNNITGNYYYTTMYQGHESVLIVGLCIVVLCLVMLGAATFPGVFP